MAFKLENLHIEIHMNFHELMVHPATGYELYEQNTVARGYSCIIIIIQRVLYLYIIHLYECITYCSIK